MGSAFSRFWRYILGPRETRILILGLDSAGKTSILYRLKLGEVVTTVPTLGFNIESIQVQNLSLVVWDLGGQERPRAQWNYYFNNTRGVIFVIDSCDYDRLPEAREELYRIISADELQDAALLVFANKQDLPEAMPGDEIIQKLGLRQLLHRAWNVQKSSALTGEGIETGLDWLARTLQQ